MDAFIKEACVENLEQALKAESKGATRIELCSNLELDGLTPSLDLIVKADRHLNIPLRIMIHPRAGNFIYSDSEVRAMLASINFCKIVGVEGVIFGVMDSNRRLDIDKIKFLTKIAVPLKVGIHKAIDYTINPLENLKELIRIP